MSQRPNAKFTPRGRETRVSRIEFGLGVSEVARQTGVSRQAAGKRCAGAGPARGSPTEAVARGGWRGPPSRPSRLRAL